MYVTLLFSLLAFNLPSGGKIEPGLEELVRKIDEVNAGIVTMRARFEQRKEISLLAEPIRMKGTFLLQKPDAMMFQFDEEHDLLMVLNQQEMITLSPKARKAERLELPKRKTDVTQMLIADRLEALLSYFSIGRVDKTQTTGGQELVLRPVRRKLKQKFQEIRIQVNEGYLIERILVRSKDGDQFELGFQNIEINPTLPDGQFQVTIPEGFQVGNRIEFIFGSGFSF